MASKCGCFGFFTMVTGFPELELQKARDTASPVMTESGKSHGVTSLPMQGRGHRLQTSTGGAHHSPFQAEHRAEETLKCSLPQGAGEILFT